MLTHRVPSWGTPDSKHCLAAMRDIMGIRTPDQGMVAERCTPHTWYRWGKRLLLR